MVNHRTCSKVASHPPLPLTLFLRITAVHEVLAVTRILLHRKVNDSQVVKDFPFKWRHVCGSLETADGLKRSVRVISQIEIHVY